MVIVDMSYYRQTGRQFEHLNVSIERLNVSISFECLNISIYTAAVIHVNITVMCFHVLNEH